MKRIIIAIAGIYTGPNITHSATRILRGLM